MYSLNSQHLARLALATTLGCASAATQASLVNGGFETTPALAPASYALYNQSAVPGWRTTASDGLIEIWSSGYNSLSNGPVSAYEGNQFAEINATQFAALYQEVSGVAAGSLVGFQFAHRGRAGIDTMQLTITDLGLNNLFGDGDDAVLFTRQYTDGNTAWGFYTSAAENPINALGNTIRFSYSAISATGGASVGNFIDAADFGIGVGQRIPEPGTLTLLGLGIACLGLARRRRA